jgi:hypothetical protein
MHNWFTKSYYTSNPLLHLLDCTGSTAGAARRRRISPPHGRVDRPLPRRLP